MLRCDGMEGAENLLSCQSKEAQERLTSSHADRVDPAALKSSIPLESLLIVEWILIFRVKTTSMKISLGVAKRRDADYLCGLDLSKSNDCLTQPIQRWELLCSSLR